MASRHPAWTAANEAAIERKRAAEHALIKDQPIIECDEDDEQDEEVAS